MRNAYKIFAGNLKGRDVGVERRIILKYSLRIYDVRVWTQFIWLRIGTNGGLL